MTRQHSSSGDESRADPMDPRFAPTGTRADSVWPASTRPLLGSTSAHLPTGFDPGQAQREADRSDTLRALDVCDGAKALRAVLGVQAVLALGAGWQAANVGQWLGLFATAGFAGLAASLVWLASVCLFQKPLLALRGGTRAALLLAWAGCLAWASAWPLSWAGLIAVPNAWRTLQWVALGVVLAAAVLLWLRWRAQLWQPAATRVRLAELQSRIRPHFLFNALNTALALVRLDPAQAETVLEDLAELFRAALAEDQHAVSLDEEMTLAQRYLAIEKVRYGQRLQLHWDIAPEVGHARVPPLVLQPLVENAVRHGIEPSAEGGQVWVQASRRLGQAVVLVSNTVPSETSQPGSGMAQANVRERLRLLHDVAGQLDVWREGALYRARIVVPLD